MPRGTELHAHNGAKARRVKPIPTMPPLRAFSSPEIVKVMDQIRRRMDETDARNGSDKYSEFTWFARQYPRCYRYHLDCADFRLSTIYDLYREIHSHLARGVTRNPSTLERAIKDRRVERVYWDFESFLSEINIALDLMARIGGTAFQDEMPLSFNRFCKKDGDTGLLRVMKNAQRRWVRRLKDYRDCFVHYTPVDDMAMISLVQYGDGFEIRGKLPVNPNVREMLGFRFSRRTELFRYACSTHRHMTALDRAVAKEIAKALARGEYPKRTSNLFFVGGREHK